MVSVWATAVTADSITLNNGKVVDLSVIPGQGWLFYFHRLIPTDFTLS